MAIVELRGVTKTFGANVAVDDLSLEVPAGSVYGFIGPNGSGKTTTLRMIMNIFRPDRGDVRVFGRANHPACTDRIGYLPEERGLYRKMRVRSLLRFHAGLKANREVGRAVDEWLERLGLAERAHDRLEALSKGMQQKVQFIAAVAFGPELLVLDEPFSGLDPVNARLLEEAVLELRGRGTTVIFSTHDMATAEETCDAIFMIHRGRKVLDGPLARIQDEHGADTLRVRLQRPDGSAAGCLDGLPGVLRVTDHGQLQELRLADGADPQAILRALLDRGAVRHFELVKPSLKDIFLRIAGPGAQPLAEAAHA